MLNSSRALNGVDVVAADAVELVLDDVEETTMQTLDQGQGFEVEGPDRFLFLGAGNGNRRLLHSVH